MSSQARIWSALALACLVLGGCSPEPEPKTFEVEVEVLRLVKEIAGYVTVGTEARLLPPDGTCSEPCDAILEIGFEGGVLTPEPESRVERLPLSIRGEVWTTDLRLSDRRATGSGSLTQDRIEGRWKYYEIGEDGRTRLIYEAIFSAVSSQPSSSGRSAEKEATH